jgi:hypothetical protein
MRWVTRALSQLLGRIRQLGYLQVTLKPAGSEADDGRVLHLFRNRAELKKSFSGVVEEVQRLKDRVKQQEGATARVQELLQELETRLASAETGYPALVFYQLRDLWTLGRTLLQQFVAELESQQLDRERRQFHADFNRRQFARRQSAEQASLDATAAAAGARGRVSELERRLAARQRFWHYFQRRQIRAQLHAATVQALLADQALSEARSARDAIDGEQGNFSGLSVDARRAINMATIAYAQVLYQRLESSRLAEHTQQAAALSHPPADVYGDRAACERLMGDIQLTRVLLEQRKDVLAEIRVRAEVLRGSARYRQAADVVPDAQSLVVGKVGVTTRVLLDDTWDISRALLR